MPSPFVPVPFGSSLGPGNVVVVNSESDRTQMNDPSFQTDGTGICTLLAVGSRWPRGKYRVWIVDATGKKYPEFGSCFSLKTSSDLGERFLVEPNENYSASNDAGVRRVISFAVPEAPEGVYGLYITAVGGSIKPIAAPSKLRLVRPVRSTHALEMLADQGRRMSRLSTGKRSVSEG